MVNTTLTTVPEDIHKSRGFKFVGATESASLEECDSIVYDQQLSEEVVPV